MTAQERNPFMYDLHSFRRLVIAGLTVFCALVGAAPVLAADSAPAYKLTKTVPLGAPDRWDYVSFDPASHRVFIAHGTEATVVDGVTGEVVGRVGGLDGAHAVVVVPEVGMGYANSGKRDTMTVFDLKTLKPVKEVKVGPDTDAMAYDPASHRLFVMRGSSKDLVEVDTANDTLAATVALGGTPEFAAADGAGKFFVNNEDGKEILRIDAKSGKLDARWPIADCEAPHGLAIDPQTHRLFSSCINSKLVVVDSENGHILATLPIGRGSDAVAFDPKRKLIFSSNGEGNLSVIAEAGADKFTVVATIPTAPAARTMALDPESGRLYLVTADIEKLDPPRTPGGMQRPSFTPGSVKLLMFDPVS
jgi:hypothetical protein